MTKALKSFRLGTVMIRRGGDLSHLPATVLKDLGKRGLAPADTPAAPRAERKTRAAAAAPARRKGETD